MVHFELVDALPECCIMVLNTYYQRLKKRKPHTKHSTLSSKVHENVTHSEGDCKTESFETKKRKVSEECLLSELENAKNCSKEEAMKYLRDFDLISEYGPCMNIKRSERYHRAVRFGLDPPKSVIIVLQRFCKEDGKIENCVWSQYII